ncbi:hypothetical protein CWI75_15840 [Kineobactrum sediminis]|uniref:Uncharacterized protein n=1 Tax=Kineobactrum sediminis TaxID=1905677 RepID=A0A2N5XYT9_9GAMM|nr:hypothetical protein [Kineobactrum sediminis]PLW81306.1 hypothetical protein CWI75_15840 [Kineobactrum sediminis]
MGLDIAFNRQLAIAAGLEIKVQTNLSAEEIAEIRAEATDPGYLAWAEAEVTCLCNPTIFNRPFE